MNNKIPFKTADILIPKENIEKWAVIACDQFTSDSKYWNETEEFVGEANSTLKITFPEIYLEKVDNKNKIAQINNTMLDYLNKGIFTEYNDSMIYIERTQPDGRIRQGIVGAIDLEAYDYRKGSRKLIRATEGTILERIPPRVKIRKDAALESPHIILLIDDAKKNIIEPLYQEKEKMTKIYDFDLMMGGGHIAGYLIDKNNIERINSEFEKICKSCNDSLLFAVGDGNHSLATAKECYELNKLQNKDTFLSRYALAEIENIHSDALDFEPIYRVLFSVDPENVIREMDKFFDKSSPNATIKYYYGEKEGSIDINIPSDKLSTGIVQEFIDQYLDNHSDAKLDYIHGIEHTKELSKAENTIGFIYDGISKDNLFDMVKATGSLPRKTFSMGESKDKRYYLECRKIK